MSFLSTLGTFQKKEQSGPPFAPTSANNGLSVDAVTGRIVLGNNVGSVLATLLSNRVIPMGGFNILFDGGAPNGVRINSTNIVVTSGNSIAFRAINTLGTVIGDMAIDTANLGLALFCGSTARGVFIWNNSVPLRGNVRIGTFPALASQNNGALLQVDGPVTKEKFISPQAASPVAVSAANDKDKIFTNEGAGGAIQCNLPLATVSAFSGGVPLGFYVQNVNGIVLQAAAGDTIRIGGVVSPAGGTVSSAVVGSFVRIVPINATEWVAISVVGAWVTP